MSHSRRWDLFADNALPRRRRVFDPYCQVRYDDDYDDFDIGRPRQPEGRPTTAGMIGFIFSMVSLGLGVVVVILWFFLQQENQQRQNLDRTRWMLYWFLFLDLLSFCGGVTATILGARGIAPTNSLYRGWSMTALILGILEIILTVIFGFIMTCAVLIFEAFRAPGG